MSCKKRREVAASAMSASMPRRFRRSSFGVGIGDQKVIIHLLQLADRDGATDSYAEELAMYRQT